MSSAPSRSLGDAARPAVRKLPPGISSSDEASEESLNLSEEKVRLPTVALNGSKFIPGVRQMNFGLLHSCTGTLHHYLFLIVAIIPLLPNSTS